MTGGHLKDFQESFQETVMSEKSKRPRRSFSAEFKQHAVDLVVKQGYSFKAAAEAVGVSVKSLRNWHEKLDPEPEPCGNDASTAMLQEGLSVSENVCSGPRWNAKSLKNPQRISRGSHSEIRMDQRAL
jgi:hypothetical protein